MVTLDQIVADPQQAETLSPEERLRLQRQCAALSLILLTSAPAAERREPDRTLSVAQVAEKLNVSEFWVRDHKETDLKSARVRLGAAVRFSEAGIEELIRRRSGE